MLKAVFLIFFIFIIGSVYSQHTEMMVNLYSGVFSFRGNGTASSTVGYGSGTTLNAVEDPFGRKPGFSVALELQAQQVTKKNNLFGLAISFEKLSCLVNVDSVETMDANGYHWVPASGRSKLDNYFTTLYPYAGHRFGKNGHWLDVTAGADISLVAKVKQTGNIQYGNETLVLGYLLGAPTIDFRPRIQAIFSYYKIGIIAGYSLGLTNFEKYFGGNAFTSFIRLGINYKIDGVFHYHFRK